jgi:hypothetical protein
MNCKKSILIIIFIISVSLIFCGEKVSDNSNDKTKRAGLTNLEIFRISYWTTYGTVGLTSMINSFTQLGIGYSISNDIKSVTSSFPSQYNPFYNFSTYYPGMLFGLNFLLSGFSFIPNSGGIIYGATLYTVAIVLCAINSIFNIHSSSNLSSFQQKLNDIYSRILDPTSYFVVGSISIIAGIANLIMWIYYDLETKKNKFPYIQNNFSFLTDGFSMTIYL